MEAITELSQVDAILLFFMTSVRERKRETFLKAYFGNHKLKLYLRIQGWGQKVKGHSLPPPALDPSLNFEVPLMIVTATVAYK